MTRFIAAAALCVSSFSLFSCGNPQPTPSSGGFEVVVTGENFATDGYPFPPSTPDDLFFQDGWQISYTHVLASFDHLTVSSNPDRSPTDQSQTGPVVATVDGPWVVDLAQRGPIESAERNGTAWSVVKLENERGRFDPTQRYAFGFSLVEAKGGTATKRLNPVSDADLATMASKGWSLWLRGVAEFKGTACRSSVPGYDFTRLPKKVNFSLGFKTPTTFKNCINPQLMPDDSRGIQSQKDAVTRAQITFHLDHPLWESLVEDAPLRFDIVAGRKSVDAGVAQPSSVEVTQDDLVGVGFQGATDAQGVALPWRYCGARAANERTSGTVSYGTAGVPVTAPTGSPTDGLRDLLDFMVYNQSTFGHLNNDGLCFPERNFSAPR